jgi:CHAD domain-containing protein
LRKVVRKTWKKLRAEVEDIGRAPSDEELHAVRIRAKQCRYAAEACEPAFGRPARRFAAAMTTLQDVLGEHHDAVVAVAWLTKAASECAPAEAFALGRLTEVEHRAARDAAGGFARAWKRARRKRLRAWL